MNTAVDQIKVAIIEDDIAIVQMYRIKFEHEGYAVRTAGDGREGLALIDSFDPDVVLLDLMMPGMSGLEMLAKLRTMPDRRHTKVLVLTNMGDSQTATKVSNMPDTDYMIKAEMTPQEVTERIRKLVAN